MRKLLLLAYLLTTLLSAKAGPAEMIAIEGIDKVMSMNPSHDTLRDRAILLLEQHFDNLKNLRNQSGPFQTGFIKSNPKVPCDYCEQSQDIELSTYVSNLLAPDKYPDGLEFSYERIEKYDDIYVLEFERGLYNVTMNVKKTVTGLYGADKKVKEGKSRTTHLQFVFELDYNDNIIGIASLSETKAPGVNAWMLEVSPNLSLTSPDFSNQQVFDASASSAALVKLGAVYYFNPFKGVNSANIWFKTGLRLSYMSAKLSSDLVDFRRRDVALDGHDSQNPHSIDLRYDIGDVNENLTAIGIEVPIGFSKRFKIGEKKELSIEIEASYTYEIVKQVSGDYVMDLTGTNHLLNADVQSSSGGSPVIYQSAPQSVLSASGEVIAFSRGNPGDLGENETTALGYLSFSFRPSIFIKKFDKIKYNIGLNFSYAAISYSTFTIDEMYFDNSRSTTASPLYEADQSTGHFFAGVFFGIKI
jgi:hypothetical protein